MIQPVTTCCASKTMGPSMMTTLAGAAETGKSVDELVRKMYAPDAWCASLVPSAGAF